MLTSINNCWNETNDAKYQESLKRADFQDRNHQIAIETSIAIKERDDYGIINYSLDERSTIRALFRSMKILMPVATITGLAGALVAPWLVTPLLGAGALLYG